MLWLLLFAGNEIATVLTVLVVFPRLWPPRDGMDWFMACMLLIPMSLTWPLWLIVGVPVLLIIWAIKGDCPWRLTR